MRGAICSLSAQLSLVTILSGCEINNFAGQSARRKKLEDFRLLIQKKMCKRWSSPKDLGSVVSRSIVKLIKSHPPTGWVRADVIPDESASR
jgi:hypothetical protein